MVTSPISRIIGKLVIAASRPVLPTRLFSSRQEAVAWLEGFRD